MTRLSRTKTGQAWDLLSLPAVARFSLLLLAVTFLGNPSCLLTTATEYPIPVASPPFADANTALATPQGGVGVPITRLIRITDETTEVVLSTDVRSDDVGRPLQCRAFINYNTSPNRAFDEVYQGDTLPAASFDEVRRIAARFDPTDFEDGCYQVSLVITHEFEGIQRIPVSEEDTAIVVWWMIKGDPSSLDFGQCPSVPPPPETDAGADGGS